MITRENNKINQAFQQIKREDFLPVEAKDYASVDAPIGIGFGQTNSQPTTVYFMLNLLDVKEGDKILDVGSGSGWTTALLAYLTGESGEVVGVEIVPELVKFGQENLSKYNFKWAKIIQAQKGVLGYPGKAPYNKILVSASADFLPYELVNQLDFNGKMVIPIKNSIFEVVKDVKGNISSKEYPGFVFVPLICD